MLGIVRCSGIMFSFCFWPVGAVGSVCVGCGMCLEFGAGVVWRVV